MVVFEHGKAAKDQYRHFKIKTVEGADDYGMMYEVLFRRYRKALAEMSDLPDLVLVDGGKGQLSMALEVLKELADPGGRSPEPCQRKDHRRRVSLPVSEKGEKVFHPQFKEPLRLGKHPALLHFLDRIRDEAHRFAITYHKKLRGKEVFRSDLGNIPGIGKPGRRSC